jgi:hypothetical protein
MTITLKTEVGFGVLLLEVLGSRPVLSLWKRKGKETRKPSGNPPQKTPVRRGVL